MTWPSILNSLLTAALLPLVGFFVLAFWGRRFGRNGRVAGVIATTFTAASFVFAVIALVRWVAKPEFNQANHVEAFTTRWITLPAGPLPSGPFGIDPRAAGSTVQPAITAGCVIDSLTIATFVLVTLLAVLIHLFSLGSDTGIGGANGGGNGERDSRKPLFYALLQLLNFAILSFLLSNSLIQMLFFWEWIGIAAYFLVSFNHDHADATGPALRGALRMFLMNAAGDAAFLVGIGILAFHTHSLAGLAFFDDQGISILSASVRGASQFHSSEFLFFTGNGFLQMHWLTWAGIAFLIAALARMAQFPFQPWAHQAAEAPTPVSAMLQGAVSLVAGIYLLARIYPILTIDARFITAIVGCVTLFIAALIAIVQTDIRKILAWSTVSQAGYMLLFLGAGGYTAGVLHLFTHAFFKTSLILAAGSILHGFAGADIRLMGGLWRRFPFTAAASLIGLFALAGAPWLSGAYSTNLGLAVVYDYARALRGQSASSYELLLFWIPALTTYLTAFGIGRWWWLIFAGPNRNAKLLEKARETPFLTLPIAILAGFSLGLWFEYFGILPLIAKSIPTTLLAPGGIAFVIKGSADAYAVVIRDTGWAFIGLGGTALLYLTGLGLSNRLRRLPGVNILDFWLRERMFFDALYEGLLLRALFLLAKVARFFDRLLGAVLRLFSAVISLLVLIIAQIERPSPPLPAIVNNPPPTPPAPPAP